MASNKPTVGGANAPVVGLPSWMFGGPLPGGGLFGGGTPATSGGTQYAQPSGGLLSGGSDMARSGWWNNAANVTSSPQTGAATQFGGQVDFNTLTPTDWHYLNRMGAILGFDPRMLLSGPAGDVSRTLDMYAPGSPSGLGNARYNVASYSGPLKAYVDAMIRQGGGANAANYMDALNKIGYRVG